MDIKTLKEKARQLEPAIRVGKQGLTQAVINEIKMQLKKRKLLKIRILKSGMEEKSKEEIREELLEKTQACLVSHVGFVITLYKS